MNNSDKIAKARSVLKQSKEVKKLMKEERSAFVLDLMLREYRSTEIEKAYVDKFNETSRNARNYIKKVKDILKKESQVNKSAEIEKTKRQYEMLFRLFLENNKPEAALQALEKKSKLQGLEAPKQTFTMNYSVNSSATEDQFKHLTLEQRLNIMKQLKAPDSNESGTGAEVIE